jgi:phosphopantothenate-cysteine ligase/phosphopantothenoylcysteine decarboxylase/phosphopantothenate--cysteine ligase
MILITAGNTLTPIDRVRGITNIFTGRTGASLAEEARARGHHVVLLTSHPETTQPSDTLKVLPFRTFDDLQTLMEQEIRSRAYSAIIHSAAVSDYAVAGVYAGPEQHDASAGKVKSHHRELWLKLVPTPKLVDRIRSDWGYTGTLVKFKLEVGIGEEELLTIAEQSRIHSRANLMVANTLEGAAEWAYVGAGTYDKVPRANLARIAIQRVEQLGF